jgi:hypothetical protein
MFFNVFMFWFYVVNMTIGKLWKYAMPCTNFKFFIIKLFLSYKHFHPRKQTICQRTLTVFFGNEKECTQKKKNFNPWRK